MTDQLPRRKPGKALADAQDAGTLHYHRDRWHTHPGGDRRHPHAADATVGMAGKDQWHLGPLDADQRVAALGRPDDETTELAATHPPGADQTADPPPAAVPDTAMGMDASEPSAGEAALPGAGSDAAGAGRPLATMPVDPADPGRTMPVDPSQAPAVPVSAAELERADPSVVGAMFTGVPGSAVGDVATISATLTILGFPTEVQHEMTWAQLAMANLARIIEQNGHTRQPADPRLINGAYDAVIQLAKARGLA